MEFVNKRVVVTGAAGGIGGAICDKLARGGAQIIGIDRSAEMEPVFRGRIEGGSDQVPLFIAADVSRDQEVNAAFEYIRAECGDIHVLVNAAGIREIMPSEDLPVAIWHEVVETNLSGTFYCSQQACRRALADGGAIINVASVAGLIGIASRPAYTATKHGIVGLTRCLARDLAPRRIRVNAVCPGIIRTRMTDAYFSDETFLADLPIFIPLGEAGEPSDVAEAVAFLASRSARYITGIALPVDGGWSAEKGFSVPSRSSAYLATAPPS